MGNTSLHMMNLSSPTPVIPSAGDTVTVNQCYGTEDVLLSFHGNNTEQNVYIDSNLGPGDNGKGWRPAVQNAVLTGPIVVVHP